MINSMTGYGEAHGQVEGLVFNVEIKTVNNRYLKTSIKLPEVVAFLEEDIDMLLRKSFERGTINYAIQLKNTAANILLDIDEASLQQYLQKLNKINSIMESNCSIDLGTLLTLPGILTPAIPGQEQAQKIKESVLAVTLQTIDKVRKMRSAEGAALAADLQLNCKVISENLEHIRLQSDTVLQQYHKKLKQRVDELLAKAKLKLDEETLAREVAIFAERSDVSEELVRLESHLKQFEQSLQTDTLAGRRLDFIAQEMLREANTIASKASDSEIAHWVVDIKCQIDRIKEQVQNVE